MCSNSAFALKTYIWSHFFKNFCLEPETLSVPEQLHYPSLVPGSLVVFLRNRLPPDMVLAQN